jgi:antitoxin VapB
MAMNIKSERAHDLARRAARLTGSSQTAAVETALSRYLEELEQRDSGVENELARVLRALDARLSEEDRLALRTTDLYDDKGLPQ